MKKNTDVTNWPYPKQAVMGTFAPNLSPRVRLAAGSAPKSPGVPSFPPARIWKSRAVPDADAIAGIKQAQATAKRSPRAGTIRGRSRA